MNAISSKIQNQESKIKIPANIANGKRQKTEGGREKGEGKRKNSIHALASVMRNGVK